MSKISQFFVKLSIKNKPFGEPEFQKISSTPLFKKSQNLILDITFHVISRDIYAKTKLTFHYLKIHWTFLYYFNKPQIDF